MILYNIYNYGHDNNKTFCNCARGLPSYPSNHPPTFFGVLNSQTKPDLILTTVLHDTCDNRALPLHVMMLIKLYLKNDII